MMRASFAVWALVFAAVLALITPSARAADLNFAGSGQLDWLYVPTQSPDRPGAFISSGLTLEASVKLAADISDHLSANVKVCFGCHGFELDMSYLDFRIADELNFRAGRFSPSFGAFNLRHDVGNHKLSDKPLAYDMGRMARLRAWNLGVLPSPFPDTGIEIDGTHWFGDNLQLDYAVYAVQGFRSADAHPLDFDFRLSHSYALGYFVDNNGRPTVGSRVGLTIKLGERSDLTLGASGMYGTYDADNALSYAIWGADLSLRVSRTFFRLEYLGRRTEMDTSDPTRFGLPLTSQDGHFTKQGASAELEQPIVRNIDALARIDGMWRIGNFPAIPIDTTVAQSPSGLSRRTWMVRYTVGGSWAIERGLRIKLSGELWEFLDKDDQGHTEEVGLHASLVGTY